MAVEEVATDHMVDGEEAETGAVVDERQRMLPRQPMVHNSSTRKVHTHQLEQPISVPNRYSDF